MGSSMSSTNPATSDSDIEWGAAAKSKRSKRSGIFYGKATVSNESLLPSTSEFNPITFSSSEEDDLPLHAHHTNRQPRTKPNRKNDKHRAQLIASLVASLGLFLIVMVAIVSLATSHSANSSKTSMSPSQLTTIINNIISADNYEELADPANIIVIEREDLDETNTSSTAIDIEEFNVNGTVLSDDFEHRVDEDVDTLDNHHMKSTVNISEYDNLIIQDKLIMKNISDIDVSEVEDV